MNYFIILLLSAFFISGCVTTTKITSADQYEEISVQGRQYLATITVHVDTGAVDYEGNYVSVGRDSAQWINPQTGRWQSAAVATLRRIRFTKRTVGALEGFLICAAPGAVGSWLLARNHSFADHNPEVADAARPVLQALLWVGILGGAGYGASVGHRTDYEFNSSISSKGTP